MTRKRREGKLKSAEEKEIKTCNKMCEDYSKTADVFKVTSISSTSLDYLTPVLIPPSFTHLPDLPALSFPATCSPLLKGSTVLTTRARGPLIFSDTPATVQHTHTEPLNLNQHKPKLQKVFVEARRLNAGAATLTDMQHHRNPDRHQNSSREPQTDPPH